MHDLGPRHAAIASLLFAAACAPPPVAQPCPASPPPVAKPVPLAPTVADAEAFVKRYNEEGQKVALESTKAAWIQSTYITPDSQWLSAKANERWLNFRNGMIEDSKRFNGVALTGQTARAMKLIKQAITMPAPRASEKVAELSKLSSELEGFYGTGKYCKKNGDQQACRNLLQLSKVMAKSQDYDALLDAWKGWRTISPKMRKPYQRFATLMNEGASELGFKDTGDLWKSGYDMDAAAFEKEADRLWFQVKPLYDQLHCYVRGKLGDKYGKDKVPQKGPIPAHLLGNMWAQEWANIYPIVEPYPAGRRSKDNPVSAALKKQKYTPKKMVRSAESFYTSLGLESLPKSFWDKSMFIKPRDREVVCHASAWDVEPAKGDLRIKMCIDQTQEDLVTIYHELGHIYYYVYYRDKPMVFQRGAHDGFHEAIGDALTLSMTPAFYAKIGLGKKPKTDEKALINEQMKMALEKVAFLPFGKLIDQWRWDVFSGKTPPSQYNAAWWKLRTKYQGVAAPVPRSESDFDPGAKYHIPANTPYTRYFLARILQFQFHQALCQAAGHRGPLHTCSIHGSKEAGKKLAAMLAMGQSEPWPNALEQIAGTRTMDGAALIAYFAPLMKWLKKENAGRTCGW